MLDDDMIDDLESSRDRQHEAWLSLGFPCCPSCGARLRRARGFGDACSMRDALTAIAAELAELGVSFGRRRPRRSGA